MTARRAPAGVRSSTPPPTRSATDRALRRHEDGGLLDPRRPHRRERRLSPPCAPRFPTRRHATGAAGSCCPASSTRTCTFRSCASSAGWAGRCSTGSSTWRCPRKRAWPTPPTPPTPRDAFRAMRSPRTAPPPRWCSGRTSRRPRAALFEAAGAAGLRIISGLVVSDRHLRPELHQSPARRLSRQHRADSPLSPPRPAALRRDAALRAVGVRGDARGLPDAAARASTGCASRRTSTRSVAGDRRSAAAVSVGARLPRRLRALRPGRRAHGAGAQRPPHRRANWSGWRRAARRSRTVRAATRRSAAASFRCAVTRRRRRRAPSAPTSAAAPASACSRKACRRI